MAMNFSHIIGQEQAKERLLRQAQADRLPHALMLAGPEGAGKLPLALALGRHLLCERPTPEGEPCEQCAACRMSAAWAHPDLHFSFPVIKKKSTDQPVSDDFLPQWREQLADTPYFTPNDWLARLGAENQQAQHYVGESDALQQKLALKASQGGRRVVIQWLPEKMPEPTANKLLKLIEEPPSHTHFILVSTEPDQVLGTIQSRTQRIPVPALGEEEIRTALQNLQALPPEEAQYVAHLAQGSWTRAQELLLPGGEDREYFDLFVSVMRLAYTRKVKDLRQWSDQVAKMGRERQKSLLAYCQRLVRENFMCNFPAAAQLTYLSRQEADFAQKFARFIHERNIIPLMETLSDCERDIEQNVNPRMVFFDLAIKLILLLKQ